MWTGEAISLVYGLRKLLVFCLPLPALNSCRANKVSIDIFSGSRDPVPERTQPSYWLATQGKHVKFDLWSPTWGSLNTR